MTNVADRSAGAASDHSTIRVVDPNGTWYLRNANSAGAPSFTPFVFGLGSWKPVVGDWDGDGTDTVGMLAPDGRWFLRNANSAGPTDVGVFSYGSGGWAPFGGEWNGPGVP